MPGVGSLAESQINVTGITSVGKLGVAGNQVLNINIGAGASVTGIGWEVNVTAFDPSGLSELSVAFGNSARTAEVDLAVGAGDDAPGVGAADSSDGIIDLVGLNLNFTLGADAGRSRAGARTAGLRRGSFARARHRAESPGRAPGSWPR